MFIFIQINVTSWIIGVRSSDFYGDRVWWSWNTPKWYLCVKNIFIYYDYHIWANIHMWFWLRWSVFGSMLKQTSQWPGHPGDRRLSYWIDFRNLISIVYMPFHTKIPFLNISGWSDSIPIKIWAPNSDYSRSYIDLNENIIFCRVVYEINQYRARPSENLWPDNDWYQ